MTSFGAASTMRQPRLHRAFGVVFMGLRIAEIGQHAVAHVFGDEAAVRSDRDPRSNGGRRATISRMSSGSSRAAIAVEPTRSQNITVSWRRSAASEAGGTGVEVVEDAGEGPASAATAFIRRLRCPRPW